MKVLRLDEEAIANGFTLTVTAGSRITVGRKVKYGFSSDQQAYKTTTTMQVLLPFPEVSSLHAEIEYGSDECTVVDRSTNGTTLNGRPIPHREVVHDGDLLAFAGYKIRIRLSDCFDDSVPLPSPASVQIDATVCKSIEQSLIADSSMWSNAQKKAYYCFTCENKVEPEQRSCSNCTRSLGLGDGSGPDPGKEIYHGLKLLRSGRRWDRLFYEATRSGASQSYLVEMRPLHTRHLPLLFLLNDDCQLLPLKHPNMVHLFTWFLFPYPGWKYDYYYVRVIENSLAVNAKALLFRFGALPWRSAVSIILESLKPLIYSLEQGCTSLADSFQTGQLWLVDLGDGTYGVKLDSHQRTVHGFVTPGTALFESEKFWSDLRHLIVAEDCQERISAWYRIIVKVASALYELITGKCPQGRYLLDAGGGRARSCPEPPDTVPIEEPALAALLLDCLSEPDRAPATLYEFRNRLCQILDKV